MRYDVIIIGAGASGIFTAYELNRLKPSAKILLIEQGKDIYKRKCPISEGKVSKCIKCKTCGIMNGWGGAGAFSDGKYNLTTDFGGWLNEYIPDKKVMDLINYVDRVNCNFGNVHDKVYETKSQLRKEALQYDLHLLQAKVRHLGTDRNMDILIKMYEYLQDKVEMVFNKKVKDYFRFGDEFQIVTENSEVYNSTYLVMAVGRSGAEWFSETYKSGGYKMLSNQVDLGVRVELPADVFEHITKEVYEAKLLYRTKQYGDMVRTFCMNPYGYVVSENVDDIITVNGHSFADEKMRSNNTNFAILVSNTFTQPFDDPYQYGKRIASLSNMLGGGVLVQRFGDLIKGRRTNEHRLSQSFVKPTLDATAGDLSLVLPKRHLDNITEMIYALDNIAKGTANDDTLLYGVEVKFYSGKPILDKNLESELDGMFCIGDGASVSRSLSQASASGVHVARVISERI